jgi:hypothetical protein
MNEHVVGTFAASSDCSISSDYLCIFEDADGSM